MRPWYVVENTPIPEEGSRRYRFAKKKNYAQVLPTFGIADWYVYQINLGGGVAIDGGGRCSNFRVEPGIEGGFVISCEPP